MISHQWTDYRENVWDLSSEFSLVTLEAREVVGMKNPKTTSFTQETPLLDGQTTTGWRGQPRRVFWPILINAQPSTWDVIQGIWWSGLRPNRYGVWRVTNGDSYRELTCRFVDDGDDGYESDPSREGFEAHIVELVADDPWWKGELESVTFQTAADELPFFAITSDRVFNLMPSNTVASATINNPGEVTVWPIYRFDGPIDSFRLSPFNPGGGDISASIEVPDGEYLILDTTPTVQTATLSNDGQSYTTDVTDELDTVGFFSIAPGDSEPLYVTLNGAGSLTVSFTPQFFRAF